MPKIKLTKSELKSQRDAMKQFSRFLPTLQLKKQQLQLEMRNCKAQMERNKKEEADAREAITHWIKLFGDDASIPKISSLLIQEEVVTEQRNIAGVDVPVFKNVIFKEQSYDLFIEEPWIDDAIHALKNLIAIIEEHKIIEKQYELIGHELRVTTQRVNLFEKVKIPECKENIRVIQIYLGDQQTAAVGRSKIAKRKMQEITA